MIWIRLWVTRFLRRFANPPPQEVAKIWHRRLTFAYVAVAWSFLGMVVLSSKKKDPNFRMSEIFESQYKSDPSSAHRLARQLQLRNPIVYRVTGEGITKEVIRVEHEAVKRDTVP